MPVIVLAGEEEFQIAKRVKALKKELVDPQWESFNFARIDNPDLKDVIDAAATVPFGPGNRMVLFERCALFTKKKADSDGESGGKSTKLVDDFAAAMGSVAHNTYLVFSCIANFDKNLKNSKAIEKHAKVENFEKLKYLHSNRDTQNTFITFCNAEAKLNGVTIDDDAAFYLADSTELNLRQISSEIAKTATYLLPEKHIRLEHVQLLCPHYSEVFDLVKHWALREKDEVLQQINEMKAKQVSPHMVLALVQTQLRKWIDYKIEYEKACAAPSGSRAVGKRDVPLQNVAAKLAPTSWMQRIVTEELKTIQNVSLEELLAKKQELTDIEHKVKTGQLPETHVLDLFFTR